MPAHELHSIERDFDLDEKFKIVNRNFNSIAVVLLRKNHFCLLFAYRFWSLHRLKGIVSYRLVCNASRWQKLLPEEAS